MKILFPLFYLVTLCAILSCKTEQDPRQTIGKIPYPEVTPDSIPLPFLPGIVSIDSFDFNSAFSPDGKSYYFSRSENDKSKIYVTHFNGLNWTDPIRAAFLGSDHSEADPAFAPDGKLYFISNRPRNELDTIVDFDIWYVTPTADNSWSEPLNFEAVNSDSAEFYISFAENEDLYFASSRVGGLGQEDIYVSKFVDGKYQVPENLGAAINTQFSEYDPFISAKGDLLIFASSGRADTFGGSDLYYSEKREDGKWQKAANLGKPFNTGTREFCPYISPDLEYFFFSSSSDVKWISTAGLYRKVR